MRKWLTLSDDLESLGTLLGHDNYSFGALGHLCDFCKARGYSVEASYIGSYDSDAYDLPFNIRSAKMCNLCAKDAIQQLGSKTD